MTHQTAGSGSSPTPDRLKDRPPNRRELRNLEVEAIREEGGAFFTEIAPSQWRSKFARALRANRINWWSTWDKCRRRGLNLPALADLLFTFTRHNLIGEMRQRTSEVLKAKKRKLAMAKSLRRLAASVPDLTPPNETASTEMPLIYSALSSCAELLELDAGFTSAVVEKNHVNPHMSIFPIVAEVHSVLSYPEIEGLVRCAWEADPTYSCQFAISEDSIRKQWDKWTMRRYRKAKSGQNSRPSL